MPARNNSNPQALRVIPLGGLGEIGNNMMILEMAEDIVIIDAVKEVGGEKQLIFGSSSDEEPELAGVSQENEE